MAFHAIKSIRNENSPSAGTTFFPQATHNVNLRCFHWHRVNNARARKQKQKSKRIRLNVLKIRLLTCERDARKIKIPAAIFISFFSVSFYDNAVVLVNWDWCFQFIRTRYLQTWIPLRSERVNENRLNTFYYIRMPYELYDESMTVW